MKTLFIKNNSLDYLYQFVCKNHKEELSSKGVVIITHRSAEEFDVYGHVSEGNIRVVDPWTYPYSKGKLNSDRLSSLIEELPYGSLVVIDDMAEMFSFYDKGGYRLINLFMLMFNSDLKFVVSYDVSRFRIEFNEHMDRFYKDGYGLGNIIIPTLLKSTSIGFTFENFEEGIVEILFRTHRSLFNQLTLVKNSDLVEFIDALTLCSSLYAELKIASLESHKDILNSIHKTITSKVSQEFLDRIDIICSKYYLNYHDFWFTIIGGISESSLSSLMKFIFENSESNYSLEHSYVRGEAFNDPEFPPYLQNKIRKVLTT